MYSEVSFWKGPLDPSRVGQKQWNDVSGHAHHFPCKNRFKELFFVFNDLNF
jgi:hypothetical protein